MEFDPDLIIPNKKLSLSEGAISVMGWASASDEGSYVGAMFDALSKKYSIQYL